MCSSKLYLMVLLFLQVRIDSIQARENTSAWLQEYLKGCPDQFYRCSQDIRHICKCDELCHQFTDCCSDAPSEEKPVKELKSDGYISLSLCNPIEFVSNSMNGVFMVSRCGENWPNDDVRKNCEKEKHAMLLDMIPVLDRKMFFTFRNQYCAICNGLSDWFGWNVRLDCKNRVFAETPESFTDTIYQAFNSSRCSIKFISPYPEFSRNCSLNLQYSTRKPEEETICATGMIEPIIVITKRKQIIARNRQCFEQIMLDINYTDINRIFCLIDNRKNEDIFSLTTILDYSSLITMSEDSRTKQCDEMDILLSDVDGCQGLFCPIGFHPRYGDCISNGLDKDFLLDFLVEFKTQIEPRYRHTFQLTLMEKVMEKIPAQHGIDYFIQMRFIIADVFSGVDSSINKSCSFVHLVVPLYLSVDYNNSESLRQSFLQTLKTCSFIIYDHTHVECIEGVQNRTCTSNFTIANPKFFLPVLSSRYERDLPCGAVEVDFITVNKTIINTTDDSNDWFSLKSSSTRIHSGHVLKIDNAFYLCISTYQEFYLSSPKQLTTFVTYVRFLTNLACNSISILSTIFLLFHYYKNILGTRISVPFIALLILLLVQQCQFLFVSIWPNINNGSVCVWLGSLHHFTWISTFSYMFVSLFRLHADIKSLENTPDTTCLRNIKSLACGFAIPAAITLGTKLSEQVTSPSDVWYGGNFCFINNPIILLCTFIIPMMFFLLANIVIFLFIIHYIRQTSNRVRHANNVGIYLRISSTLGFTWIIGVINGMVKSEALAWIFEITTNLQGFTIMLGFMCNKRMFLAYKEKLFAPKEQNRKNLFNSTSSCVH